MGKKSELKDFIYVENNIPHELCEKTLEYIEMLEWTRHMWGSYNREEGTIEIDGSQSADPLVAKLLDESHNTELRSCVHDVIKTFYKPRLNLDSLRFNRYRIGERLTKHVDHITSIFDGERKGIPILSVIGQLNDNYEGGELVINDEIIPLKQGDICVFPSVYLYPHEIRTVTKGERISFVTWAY